MMMPAELLILLPALIGLGVLLLLRRRRQSARPDPVIHGPAIPRHAIVVDGSNVMHWGGAASAKVLALVLRALQAKGYAPIVIFDASAGYRLADRYLDASALSPLIGLPAAQVSVVDKGVIADSAILRFAAQHRLRIVSNDLYRDWRVQFPHLRRKGAVLRGRYDAGAVVWNARLKPVRA
ncbi:NYN domain-containing protein [Yoonia vestfoldensis]|uniref:Zc3h12a-like ribonuclease NYN domain protein n=1 Tax=Yoonia vestfoldensis TaxID=245188 RepID=A0A1Y0EDC3_9RHOB|nr:hypothetical protein [Yoonia vestfoldensis]ARU01616.1 Zc3h12a-like ribonuclease NYN domain protein [Yoonia vestfoldensis]